MTDVMLPSSKYQQLVQSEEVLADTRQEAWLAELDTVFSALVAEEMRYQKHLGKWLGTRKQHFVHGLYLWGSVGIGKTFLLDLFYESLPFSRKLRQHFHVFMRETHEALKQLQGKSDPLKIFAKQLAKQYRIICFDEFVVEDIADAMLLGGLFAALFEAGVTLVATSNTPPDKLYERGLQRRLFLPSIEMLKQHVKVVTCESDTDYRRRLLEEAGVYYCPLDEKAKKHMDNAFQHFAVGEYFHAKKLVINGHTMNTLAGADNLIWVDFKEICVGNYSQRDYLTLAEQYEVIMLSDVQIMPSSEHDTICRFINFIDVVYDARCALVVSAAAQPEVLYTEGLLLKQYERTQSRLIEMQSEEYLSGCITKKP